jgi:hypothetical protein
MNWRDEIELLDPDPSSWRGLAGSLAQALKEIHELGVETEESTQVEHMLESRRTPDGHFAFSDNELGSLYKTARSALDNAKAVMAVTEFGQNQRKFRIKLPHRPLDLAVEPLPDWWPDEPVYHGTSLYHLREIGEDGLCIPNAEQVTSGDSDYGWDAVWNEEVYTSYKHHLNSAQRKVLNTSFFEGPMRKTDFGSMVSLFFVSKHRSVADSHEVSLEVDLSELSYLWWFPDEILGEHSYCFVCPTACPQMHPKGLKVVNWRGRAGSERL